MDAVGRLVSAALALAAVVALSGGSASATRSATDLTAARAFAVQVAVPGQPGGATPSVSAPPDAVGVGGSFAYPADGSVINAGSVTYGAFANPGDVRDVERIRGRLHDLDLRRRRNGGRRQRQVQGLREQEDVVGRFDRIDRDRARHPGPGGDARRRHAVPDRRLGLGDHAPAGPDVTRHEALRRHARVRDRSPGAADRRPLRAPRRDRGDDRLRRGGREVRTGADGRPEAASRSGRRGASSERRSTRRRLRAPGSVPRSRASRSGRRPTSRLA